MDASSHWHRIAGLKPRLAPGTRIHRHRFRGETWLVLQAPGTVSHHRLSRAAQPFLDRLDGKTSVEQCMQRLGDGAAAPSRDEVLTLLADLHAAQLVECDVSPDVASLLEAHADRSRSRRARQAMNPLALRIPLVDPDPLLERLRGVAGIVFSPIAAVAWLALVGLAISSVYAYWPELARATRQQLLDPGSLAVMLLVYPLMKAIHEFAHGLAVKRLGGAVHEAGVMLLVLFPLPYVDASSAWGFAARRDRMLVAAAGVMAELALAAAGFLIWLNVQPGLLRDAALQAAVIGSLSSVLFNGNPLLRFDGYYVLSDLLEIPNLASRAQAHVRHLAKRWLLAVRESSSPVTAEGEAAWLLAYGVLSALYRIVLTLSIALFVATLVPVLGIVLALWSIAVQLLWPLARGLHYALTSAETALRRRQAWVVTAALVGLPVLFVGTVPIPSRTHAEGVIWVSESGRVHADTDGFIRRVRVRDGQSVAAGEAIIDLEDPLLDHELVALEARREELALSRDAVRMTDPVTAAALGDALAALESERSRLAERIRALVVRAPVDGTVSLVTAQRLEGRWVARGDLVALLIDPGLPRARMVVTQEEIARVRRSTTAVNLKRLDLPQETMSARIRTVVPGASRSLPSEALGARGGGRIAVDVLDQDGRAALSPVFHVELDLPPQASGIRPGTRVVARFEHRRETLAQQAERALRQLLLARLGA